MKLSIDLLKPDPLNARRISDGALGGLAVSAETFGDLSGITWNEQLGLLVAGHQRMRVLRTAGAVQWVREGDGGYIVHPKTKERFRIRVVKWDETTHRMAELTANNQHIQGEYEDEMVAAQLAALEHDDRFSALRLAHLEEEIAAELAALQNDEEPVSGQTDADDIPEPPKVPTTKPGDLWILGDHRLLCGDSTKTEDVARLMGGGKAALCCTDPPYGVNFTDAQGTNISADMSYSVIPGFFGIAVDALGDGRAFLCFGAETNYGLYVALFGRELRMRPKMLFWKKPQFVLRHHDYHSQYECIFYGWKPGGDVASRWRGDRKQSDVWEVAHDESRGGDIGRLHPTQKPVELFRIPMQNHTVAGEVCYEPFSGSGSQIIAGQSIGRRVFAMEQEPVFCDVAVARWEAFTGLKAVLET